MEKVVQSGQLSEVFFPELLHQIRLQRVTGLLRITLDNILKAIFFENGLIAFAISNLKTEQLEQLLISQGLINELMLGAPGLERGKRLAASLIATNLLPRSEVVRAVQEQALGIIYSIFDWEHGSFTFDEKARANHDIKLVTSPGDIILEGVRRIKRPEYFQHALAQGEACLEPTKDTQMIYQGLNLRPTEAYILSRVDQPTKAKDLVALAGLPEQETYKAAYCLVAAGMLNIIRPERKVEKPAAKITEQATAENEKEEMARLRAEVLRATHVFAAEDYYEVLGITQRAETSEIKRTYYGLAKKFHPDRSHTLGDNQLRDRLEKIFQKISEAYETLADPERRRVYDEGLQSKPNGHGKPGFASASAEAQKKLENKGQPLAGADQLASAGKSEATDKSMPPGAPATVAASAINAAPVVTVKPIASEPATVQTPQQQAETFSKMATAAFNRGDLITTADMLRQAVAANPEDKELRFQLIKVLMRNKRWHQEVETHYLYLIQREPFNEKFHMMLGNFYKETGQKAKADTTFRHILELNPGHGRAQRELKPGTDGKGKQAKGLLQSDMGEIFSKFFKR